MLLFARRFTALCLLSFVAASCGGGSTNGDAGEAGTNTYQRPNLRPGELLFETPEFEVQPGTDYLYCHYIDMRAPAAMDQLVMEIHSYQQRYGHHISLNYTEEPQSPVSRRCTEQDMIRTRLVGAGNESAELMFRLPPGVVVRIPRGAQIVLQSHYINPTDQTMRVRDAITALPPPAGMQVQIADPFAMSDGEFRIPPRTAAYGRTMECTIDRDMNVVNYFGHAHEWTTRLWIEHAPMGSNTFSRIYDEPGARGHLMDSPPMRFFDTANALRWRSGDRVRVSCDWNNTTDHVLEFPEEMCAAVFYAYPGMGFRSCGNVIETRGAPDAGTDAGPTGNGNAGCSTPWAPGMPCVRPCNTGNELGIGKYCTPNGRQCEGNRSAIVCTADVDPTSPGFCTRGCTSDQGCGSGMRCVGDSRGRGCVPVECAGDPTPDGGTTEGGTDATAPRDGGMDATVTD